MLLTLAPAAACALADPKQRGRGGCAAVSLVLGLKLRALRVGAALLSLQLVSEIARDCPRSLRDGMALAHLFLETLALA